MSCGLVATAGATMRLLVLGLLAATLALAGCSSTGVAVTPASSAGARGPTGRVTPTTLIGDEIVWLKRDVIAYARDPSRPLIDTIAGAADEAGNRYACSTVYGKAETGGNPSPLPFAGTFVNRSFKILAFGGTTAQTRAAEDVCRGLGILPRRR